MPLIDFTRVVNNLIVLGVLVGIGFMIWSRMDKGRTRETIDGIKRLFGGKKE